MEECLQGLIETFELSLGHLRRLETYEYSRIHHIKQLSNDFVRKHRPVDQSESNVNPVTVAEYNLDTSGIPQIRQKMRHFFKKLADDFEHAAKSLYIPQRPLPYQITELCEQLKHSEIPLNISVSHLQPTIAVAARQANCNLTSESSEKKYIEALSLKLYSAWLREHLSVASKMLEDWIVPSSTDQKPKKLKRCPAEEEFQLLKEKNSHLRTSNDTVNVLHSLLEQHPAFMACLAPSLDSGSQCVSFSAESLLGSSTCDDRFDANLYIMIKYRTEKRRQRILDVNLLALLAKLVNEDIQSIVDEYKRNDKLLAATSQYKGPTDLTQIIKNSGLLHVARMVNYLMKKGDIRSEETDGQPSHAEESSLSCALGREKFNRGRESSIRQFWPKFEGEM